MNDSDHPRNASRLKKLENVRKQSEGAGPADTLMLAQQDEFGLLTSGII